MSDADAFAKSLSSAIRSVLHVLEEINALKALVDRTLPERKEGPIVFGPPWPEDWAKDAGRYLCTGLSWAYPIMKKGAKGKPARKGTLWFWCRVAPPKANSKTVDDPIGPFIAVEVTEGKPDDYEFLDDFDHPSEWPSFENAVELEGISFHLPLLKSAATRNEHGRLTWAGFSYKLGAMTDPADVNRDLIEPAVALAKLLVANEPGA